jgi:hypothetical protein
MCILHARRLSVLTPTNLENTGLKYPTGNLDETSRKV